MVYEPSAEDVMVMGSFTGWKPERMEYRGGGIFAKEIVLKSGRYEYVFIVDGRVKEDPTADAFVEDGFRGRNSVLYVPF